MAVGKKILNLMEVGLIKTAIFQQSEVATDIQILFNATTFFHTVHSDHYTVYAEM